MSYQTILKHIRIIVELSRLNNPKPILLLFFPCIWGIFLAYAEHISKIAIVNAMIIFFIGSIAGRSFGCVVNDILDRDIDKEVKRTKNRPLASSKVSIRYAIIIAILWLLIGFSCFTVFNSIAKLFIIIGLCISLIYPLTKRFFPYPQFILGLAFNIGVLVGYSAVYRMLNNTSILLYILGVYWTLFYDTIYAMQDVEDDKKLNLKSTALKYGNLTFNYLLKFSMMIIGLSIFVGILERMPWQYYIMIIPLIFVLINILRIVAKEDKSKLQYAFNMNINIGVIIAIQILLGKIFHG